MVDYKTGKAPPEARALAEFKAMFQMKFYAVALLRSRGVLPARLRLLYLADGQVLDYTPDLDELLRFEKTLMAIWRAIQSAGATGDFRPNPSRMCDWCAHHAHCPVFGGTPPPYPGWPAGSRRGLPPRRRCCTPRSLLRDRLPLPSARRRRRLAVFDSTDGTRSNWDPEIQHGSPPLALMTKLIEELAAGSGLRVGRLTLDILGAIPVAPVQVRAWVERPGKRISLMAAEMRRPGPTAPTVRSPGSRRGCWPPATPPTPPPTAIPRWSKVRRSRCRTAGWARRAIWRR